MFRSLLLAVSLLAAASTPAVAADNFAVKDATATTITKRSKDVGSGVQADANVLLDSSYAVVNPATSTLQAAVQSAAGTAATTALTVQGSPNGVPQPTDTIVRSIATDRGAIVATASTAQTLMPINTARRGFSVQNQSGGACYISGAATATLDYHSLLIPAGSLYETKDSHVGTGAISIVCANASASVYAREW